MKVTGGATLNAPIETVWTALNDPAVLVRTIPGCERLEATGPDSYRLTITTGMAAVRGTYTGEVQLADQQAPGSFTLKASGAGGPGTISTDVRVRLTAADDGSTRLSYDADAVVGGVIAGVGQRMLAGVAKRMAEQFFGSVDELLTGSQEGAGSLAAAGAALAGAGSAEPGLASARSASGASGAVAQPSAGQAQPGVFVAPPRARTRPGGPGFAVGTLAGGAIALAGALVGAAIAGGLISRRKR
jgi:uncharacterized protein